jgi:ketosteroid isomerase-like protein
MVVVLGSEHQRVKRSGKELKQQWVQVYTVENNLITRMEEFATSEGTNNRIHIINSVNRITS